MIRIQRQRMIILVFLVLGLSSEALSAQRVVESTFCLEIDKPECRTPCVTDTIHLSQVQTVKAGEKRLYFWTKISIDEDKNIMHVWRREGDPAGTKPVHVAMAGKIKNLALEVVAQAKDFLQLIYNSDQKNQSLQGVILPINKSPSFRTYSSIKATPGKYSVGVYDLNRNIIPGGEPKSVEILP